MTLQEAHKRQRRELLSLRAENKRLQKQASGVFPVSAPTLKKEGYT